MLDTSYKNADLRGQNFKGKNLSGLDFTGTDIRGTNFSNAILKGVNFSQAKAGVQLQWRSIQFLLAFIVTILTGTLSGLNSSFTTYFFKPGFIQEYTVFPGIALLVMFVTVVLIIVLIGFTFEAFIIISIAGAIAFATAGTVAFAVAGVVAGVVAVAIAGSIAVAFSFTIGGAFTVAFNFVAASFTAVFLSFVVAAFVSAGFFSPNFNFTFKSVDFIFAITSNSFKFNFTFDNVIAFIFAIASNGLGIYVLRRSWEEDKKFSLLQTIITGFGAIGGTNFENADLTDADFTKATLKGCSFFKADLTRICWDDAKGLRFAKVEETSILVNPAVRELLITRKGRKQSYRNANLRGANLNGVNLEQADLRQSDLSNATLRTANLTSANLTEVMAVGTDFTGACLTGACLESWNIDSNTKLREVNCKFVYLKNGELERRPSSGNFLPGDFSKLFEEVLNTIDLIFREGIDWIAFIDTFKKVQVKNQETELTVKKIESKDGILVIRVSVSDDANKEKIQSDFNKGYNPEYTTVNILKDIVFSLLEKVSSKQISIQIDNNTNMMNSKDSSRTVNISDSNVNASGAGTLSLANISGIVANTINQLPSTSEPHKPGIKELLEQLKTAIESELNLNDKDRDKALKYINNIAEVGKNPQDKSAQEKAEPIIDALKGMFAGLTNAANLVKAGETLIPLIAKIFGL